MIRAIAAALSHQRRLGTRRQHRWTANSSGGCSATRHDLDASDAARALLGHLGLAFVAVVVLLLG